MALSTDPMGMEEGRDESGHYADTIMDVIGPPEKRGYTPIDSRGEPIGFWSKIQKFISSIPTDAKIVMSLLTGKPALAAIYTYKAIKEDNKVREQLAKELIDEGLAPDEKTAMRMVNETRAALAPISEMSDGADFSIAQIGTAMNETNSYGNWWENTAGPISVGGGPGMRMPGSGTWIRTEDGRQYFMTPEMLSPGYNGPIAWAGGKYTLPSDPDDPRNAEYVRQQQGAATGDITGTITDSATGYTYPANTMSSPLMADPKTDTWNNFLDSYFGIKPTDEDPGVPSYLDRVLRDVTFKQDEGKEFLDRLNQISQETVSGLQPYSSMLRKQVESTKPIGLSFGGTPMASFISRPDREVGRDYNAVIQQIAAAKKDPANVRFGMADMMSPEKGYIDYMKNYENLIRLALNKEAVEKELAIKQQEVEQKDTDFSWVQAAKDIIGLGSSGYDLYKTIFP